MTDTLDLDGIEAQREFANRRVASLHALADFIDDHPEFAAKFSSVTLCTGAADETDMTRLARALGGERRKDADSDYFAVSREFGCDTKIEVFIQRDKVCSARVVGTEEVEVPDPDAPKVKVTRDVIEWECSPLLAEVTRPDEFAS